jgi:hypothetical protein
MFEQHPDKIIIPKVGESSQDENGDFVAGVAGTNKGYKGRYEPTSNVQSSFIIGDNGQRIEYKGIFYGPVDMETIPLGTTVKVIKKDGTLIVDRVAKFHRSQINTRIWL